MRLLGADDREARGRGAVTDLAATEPDSVSVDRRGDLVAPAGRRLAHRKSGREGDAEHHSEHPPGSQGHAHSLSPWLKVRKFGAMYTSAQWTSRKMVVPRRRSISRSRRLRPRANGRTKRRAAPAPSPARVRARSAAHDRSRTAGPARGGR